MAGEVTSRIIRILFEGDADGVRRAAGDAESSFSKFNRIAVGASLGIIGGAVAIGSELVQMAAQAEQSIGSVDTVFRENSAQVKQWATDAATNLGLSSHAYREAATLIGSQLKNMGIPMDQVAGSTDKLITKGADLASMFGGTTQEAVDALSSALKGEADPIERYGISLNAAAIEAKKAELGLGGLTGAADRNAQAMAVMAIIEDQSADATGNFAREQGTAAGQAERAKAQWENLQTTIGEQLLPIMTQLGEFISGTLLPILQEHGTAIFIAAGAIVGLAGAVLAINAAITLWTAAQWLLNASLWANPLTWVVLGILALVAAFVIAYQNSETFRNIVNGAFEAVKSFIADSVENIKKIIGWFAELPGRIGAWFGGMKDAAIRKAGELVGWLAGLPGRVLGAFGNIGSMLLGSGRALVDGFLAGIRGAWDRVVGFVRQGMQWLRDFWPFSPAKQGAFSGTGYVTHSGKALTSDFADSLHKGMPGVIASARELMAATNLELHPDGIDPAGFAAGPMGAGAARAAAPVVQVFIDGQEFKGMIRTEIAENGRQTRRGVGSGAYRGV